MPTKAPSPVSYRPDIDGLRAVSVLLVLGFHAFPRLIPGGFIGVDIFFVISGYLISGIIMEGLSSQTFQFSDFFKRRIKRIFPALILVLFSCYFFGWFSLLSTEYKQLAKHVVGGTLFSSNFLNWSEAGYFDNSAETKPLLHLWSLGIEEQFYLFWPLILAFCWKMRINFFWPVVSLTLISFYLNLRTYPQDHVAAFFSPQTRFWEILSGSLLVLFENRWKSKGWTRLKNPLLILNFFSFFGALLLIFGLFKITKDLSFPGKWGVVPVLSAILIIGGGPQSWLNRFVLSRKALVWIGLISFPLYLWHWPLFSFAIIIEDGDPSLTLKLWLLAASFLLAWATFYFIEVPIRLAKLNFFSWKRLSLAIALIGGISLITFYQDGFSFRKHANLNDFKGDIGHLDFHRYISKRYYPCEPRFLNDEAHQWEGFVRCAQTIPGTPVDIAIIGDSHAEHLFIGLAEQIKDKNIAFYIKSTTPFLSNPSFKNIFEFVSNSESIRNVILTMAWARRLNELPLKSSLTQELRETTGFLQTKGKRVFLTDDVPTFPFSAKRCKGKTWLSSKKPICESPNDPSPIEREIRRSLEEIVTDNQLIELLDTKRFFCSGQNCKMTFGDKILFRDEHHLNIEGSRFLGKMLRDSTQLAQISKGDKIRSAFNR